MGTVPRGTSLQTGGDSAMEAVAVEAFYVFSLSEENYGEASPATAAFTLPAGRQVSRTMSFVTWC